MGHSCHEKVFKIFSYELIKIFYNKRFRYLPDGIFAIVKNEKRIAVFYPAVFLKPKRGQVFLVQAFRIVVGNELGEIIFSQCSGSSGHAVVGLFGKAPIAFTVHRVIAAGQRRDLFRGEFRQKFFKRFGRGVFSVGE